MPLRVVNAPLHLWHTCDGGGGTASSAGTASWDGAGVPGDACGAGVPGAVASAALICRGRSPVHVFRWRVRPLPLLNTPPQLWHSSEGGGGGTTSSSAGAASSAATPSAGAASSAAASSASDASSAGAASSAGVGGADESSAAGVLQWREWDRKARCVLNRLGQRGHWILAEGVAPASVDSAMGAGVVVSDAPRAAGCADSMVSSTSTAGVSMVSFRACDVTAMTRHRLPRSLF